MSMKAALSLFVALGVTAVASGFFAGGDLPKIFSEENDRADRLSAQQNYVYSRADYKRTTTTELIAGRITYKQAAAEFKNLNEFAPECMSGLRSTHPGVSDEEIVRLDIIEYVESMLDAKEAAKVVARLDGESYE
jgi:hypothetical protein